MSYFEHVVPQVGPVKIRLFPPADQLYKTLRDKSEVSRLSKLRHLGALSFALEGARLARWDYTAALTHYSQKLDVSRFNSKFSVGRVTFSSAKAALQVASLAWNIGHLPGTFSVEKGVYRYLSSQNSTRPASSLNWKFRNREDVKLIIRKSNENLLESDFYSLSKVLSILKLLSWCESDNDFLYYLTIDFIAPLFLNYDLSNTKQWSKIREAFKLVRHVAYLTLDAPFSGDNWIPSMPDYFQSQISRHQDDIYKASSKISESLSPVELNMYERLYHCRKARLETAIYAKHVHDALYRSTNPLSRIDSWLSSGLTRDLKVGKRYKHKQINSLLSIKFRTHLSQIKGSIVKVERDLINRGYCHSAIHKYHSWNSDTLLEPDEYIIDVQKRESFTSEDLGKLFVWIMDTFDDLNCTPENLIGVSKKIELESAYKEAFSKAFNENYRDVNLSFEPWPLNDYGVFPLLAIQETKGSAWASKGKMGETITRHLLRDRSANIEPHLRDSYKELSGIRALRLLYRRGIRAGKKPRCRWIIFTSSIILNRDGNPFLEFDGGILKISTRSGRLTWYGLETKNGNENPASSLRRRLRKHGIHGDVTSIDTSHAYVEMEL